MALETEVWSGDIEENLFANNSFVQKGVDHSGWINHKTVHIPQAGANPVVKKDRATLPATIGQRTDTDLTYNMGQYTTNPLLITDLEDLQISYSKRQSVWRQHIDTLGDAIGNHTAFNWSPSGDARIVRTSGSASALSLAPGATGTRLALVLANITAARAVLDYDNVPAEGRIMLIPSDIYNNDLLNIADTVRFDAMGQSNLPTGVVARLFGFDIMIRPSVSVYDNQATPVIKPVADDGVATEATDNNMAILCFHPNFVAQAVGSTKIFFNEDAPEYYGSILSGEQMFGAAKLRTDQKGIVAIIQAA